MVIVVAVARYLTQLSIPCETTLFADSIGSHDRTSQLASGEDVLSLNEHYDSYDITPRRGLRKSQLVGLANPHKQMRVVADIARSLHRDPSLWSLFGRRCASCP